MAADGGIQSESETLLETVKLVEAVRGLPLGSRDLSKSSNNFVFTSVTTDSRTVCSNSLFVPLIGAVQNGHSYIPQAIEKGATVVFVADVEYTDRKDYYDLLAASHRETLFIVVESTLSALQQTAAAYIDRFPELLRVGITGSSGKTTTKEITGAIFAAAMPVVMNEGNLNTETGMPLSAFRIRKEHRAGIFEMGMDHRGEIAGLASVLRPHIALITNVGTAHIGILGSRQAIAEEKKQIFLRFMSGDTGFVPAEDDFRDFLLEGTGGSMRLWSLESCGITDVRSEGLKGTSFSYRGQRVRFPLPGMYNLKNAAAAVCVAECAGISPDLIRKGLESVKPLFGRGQVFEGKVTVVQDCYNSNPDSLDNALNFCDEIEWPGRRIYVLGDMLEQGLNSCEVHREAGIHAARSKADMVVFFGPEMAGAYEACAAYAASSAEPEAGSKQLVATTEIEEVIQALAGYVRSGDLVFLKGSRRMALERVTPYLLDNTREAGSI